VTRRLNVVVAHDYLTSRGGAERVVLALARGFGASRIVTSLYEPKPTFEGLSEFPVQASWLDRFASLRRDHAAVPSPHSTCARRRV